LVAEDEAQEAEAAARDAEKTGLNEIEAETLTQTALTRTLTLTLTLIEAENLAKMAEEARRVAEKERERLKAQKEMGYDIWGYFGIGGEKEPGGSRRPPLDLSMRQATEWRLVVGVTSATGIPEGSWIQIGLSGQEKGEVGIWVGAILAAILAVRDSLKEGASNVFLPILPRKNPRSIRPSSSTKSHVRYPTQRTGNQNSKRNRRLLISLR